MDLSWSSEQQQLRDSVERWVAQSYPFETRRKLVASELGWGRDNWKQFAELGWLGAALPEDIGGIGGSALETLIVMEAFGRGLVLEPYLPTIVLGCGLIADAGSAAQKKALIAPAVEGKLLMAFAYAEPQSRYELHNVATKAEKQGAGFVLSGHKGVVINGGEADRLIVSARTGGAPRDAKGISLFVVDPKAKGVRAKSYPTVDGGRAAEITLDGVAVGAGDVVGPVGEALPIIERAIDRGIAAVAAEATGAMIVLHDTTLDYLKTRKQFGVALSTFQALQHRMVDMFVHCEESRSMALKAALELAEGDGDPATRARTLSAVKVQIGKAGRAVGQDAVQLHGGMGMTMEYKVGHYFKRLACLDTLFGDVDHHLERFGRAG
jgi:alkylation response protein AidB-like acyl-CoA dehydrogenase